MNEEKKSYVGHRVRLRGRFLKTGFEGFHDYEILDTRYDRSHSILKSHILRIVSDPTAPHFKAWLQHMEGAANG